MVNSSQSPSQPPPLTVQIPFISIVIIGKNEGRNLPRLHASLAPLAARWACETIFVDSASSDDSVVIGRSLFDTVVELAPSPHLNASAGRHVGVSFASGSWALFLDGDMELMPDCLDALAAHFAATGPMRGAVGTYVNRFSDGSIRRWSPEIDRRGCAVHFGGAVLLPMQALRTENWDPRLYSNEEIELHTRLRQRGFGIRRLDADFIAHWTESISARRKLIGNFAPHGSFLGKKFYGVGQVLRASVAERRLWGLVRWFPEPFVLWGAILLSPLLAIALGWPAAAALVAAACGYVVWRRSWRLVIVFLAFLPQALHGWRRFAREWKPTTAQVYRRATTPTS